ncbi:MAG: VanZ family protein [Clostridia bacterium]|nr:VanZ family protein [Clostridia bacterium]
MNIRIIKRIIFAILIIINCVVIFNFSSQNSENSSKQSDVVVERVVNTIERKNKKAKKDPTLRDRVTFYVRKTAHFTIYTILGIWLMNEANTFDITKKRKWIICVLFGFIYATSDEFHQSFVGGRSQEIRDILIDTSGVAFGCLLVVLACLIIKNLFHRKNKEIEKGENA